MILRDRAAQEVLNRRWYWRPLVFLCPLL